MLKLTADEIRMLRQARGMQQKEVAVILGITSQRYSMLEKNNNRPDNRTIEILTALKYTVKSAREFLDSIPPRKTNRLKH